MNKLIIAVIVLAAAGLASAGELENSAVSADLNSAAISRLRGIEVPVPVMERAAGVSAAFKDAVKKKYEALSGYNDLNNGENTIDKLPIAKVSELPAAAQKQLKKDNAQWGPDYLSVPYKMPVQGKTVYVIQNENDGGMFVTIFDANGALVAEGACSESGEFGWSGEKAVMTKNASSGKVTRKCWNYDKELVTATFDGKDLVTLTKNGKSCTIRRDPAYPSGHVPAEYRNWLRYYEDAKTDASTHYGEDNPCTIALGAPAPGQYDHSGVFSELRLDSALSDPGFRDSANMVIETNGDGAGPGKDKFICR